jgi:DNA-directed RNA polymerase alpha subunit
MRCRVDELAGLLDVHAPLNPDWWLARGLPARQTVVQIEDLLDEAAARLDQADALTAQLAKTLQEIKVEPIERCNFSIGTHSVLARSGLTTVAHLAGASEAELSSLANVGPKRIAEVRSALAERGLQLRSNPV